MTTLGKVPKYKVEMVRLFHWVAWAVCLVPLCNGLLEEEIVSFGPRSTADSALSIVDSPIICAKDDFIGIHIAAHTLAADFQQITGRERSVVNFTSHGNLTSVATAIIIGSLNSSLVQTLVANHIIDVSEIRGKWETFKTTVVDKPLPGVARALVIVGSDKRGTIFGVYTLAEQSGQSPYGANEIS